MPAISAQTGLWRTDQAIDRAMKRLGSGDRITQAGDDAAGLAISENLRAQIRGQKQARRNAQDGISMAQVAEGGLSQMTNMLIRLRELAIQAASDTIGDKERQLVDIEYQQIKQEMQRITESTEYNGTSLLVGEGAIMDIQIGIHNDPRIDRLSYDPAKTDASVEALGLTGINVLTKENAQTSLGVIDAAMTSVGGMRANYGALQNRLSSVIENLSVANENLQAANSRIRDTDYAEESAELARQNVIKQAQVAVLAQANQQPQYAMQLLNSVPR